MSGMLPGGYYSFRYYSDHYPPPSAPSLSPDPKPNACPGEIQQSNPPVRSPYSASDFTSSSPYPADSYDPQSSQAESPSQLRDPRFAPYESYNPSTFDREQQFSAHPHLQQQAHYPHDPYTPALDYCSRPIHNPSSNPSFSSAYESGFDTGRSDVYENKAQTGSSGADDGFNVDAYWYDDRNLEPYGARGIEGPSTSKASCLAFDDYGRTISVGAAGQDGESGERIIRAMGESGERIIRAMPKADAQQDVKNGVRKFLVKLLPDEFRSIMHVICQIGLDGIHMLDPRTNKTLRLYPLQEVTSLGFIDPSIFCFWVKSSPDVEPMRLRLESNQYTTRGILDTTIAAYLQLKEMQYGLRHQSGATDAQKQSTQPLEEKQGLIDWMKQKMPANDKKDHWVPDEAVSKCTCGTHFNAFLRKHHCRKCGGIFCDKCTLGRIALTADENALPVRVCDICLDEVAQRMSHAKKGFIGPANLQSHEELARKIQEAMDKSRKTATGSESDGSTEPTREVACPTCTVHLQVQIPGSGSHTLECGVCQHQFILTAP